MPSEERPRSAAAVAFVLAGTVLSGALVARLAARASHAHAYAAFAARFAAVTADLHRARYERPVLRGAAVEGNALEGLYFAVRDLDALDAAPVHEAFEAMKRGEPTPPQARALIAAHASALAALRASTQRGWTWTRDPYTLYLAPLAPRSERVDVLEVLGAKLLALGAVEGDAGECLRVAADVVRVGQDRGARDALVTLMEGDAMPAVAAALVSRCAPRATAAERLEASREFASLAAHPPSTGEAFAVDLVAIVAAVKGALSWEPLIPRTGQGLRQVWLRGEWLDVTTHLLDTAMRLRAVDARRYPEGLRLVRALAPSAASGNRDIAAALPDLVRVANVDAEAQLRVRALSAALAVSAGATADAGLTDPFMGRALVVERVVDGVSVRSPGADGRDGTGDDVEVRVATVEAATAR